MSAHLQDIARLLETIEFFQGLSHEDFRALAQNVIHHRFRAGELIVNYGDMGSSMYLIVSGDVNIYIPDNASRRLSLKDISSGEHFGEMALFDHCPRSASAIATTDVEALELTRETLLQLMQRQPQVAVTLLQTLSSRLRQTDMLLSQRVSKNVEVEFEKRLTWKDRVADKVAALNGSWVFILLLLGMTAVWMLLNSGYVLNIAFDPYPYVFFNLMLAVLVALQGPLIVMSQNRQASKDRTHMQIDYEINLKNEVNIETLLRELGEFRMEANHRLGTLEAQFRHWKDQR